MVVKTEDEIAVDVLNQTEGWSDSLSGQMVTLVDNKRLSMESFTGQSIGSTAVAEKYQPALNSLATADLLDKMQLIGTDATKVKLAEFTVEKGGASNLTESANAIRNQGLEELKMLGRSAGFKRTIGGN